MSEEKVVLRDDAGRLLPGEQMGNRGRVPGSMNSTTRAAAELYKARAHEAAAAAAAMLADPNPFIRLAAIKHVADLAERAASSDSEETDVPWIQYLEDSELDLIIELRSRALSRMNPGSSDEQRVIDITPTFVVDPEMDLRKAKIGAGVEAAAMRRDEFTLETLPVAVKPDADDVFIAPLRGGSK